jgi:hypothetical protein
MESAFWSMEEVWVVLASLFWLLQPTIIKEITSKMDKKSCFICVFIYLGKMVS